MDSIYINPATNDLAIDINGSIALATGPYALAQSAANAIKTFSGEAFYDTSIGVPYWSEIIGKFPPPLTLAKAQMVKAALTVPGVVSAKVFISSTANRTFSGQVQVTDANGIVSAANF